MFWLALITTLLIASAMTIVVCGNKRIIYLRDVADTLPAHPPKVSLIVAARDEERNIEAAMRSLLEQDYPDYEVIVVDDRSGDATPQILQRLSAESPQLKVVRIDELPEGWLGKNNALHNGAAQASGDIYIFADADVIMRRDTLRRAVAYAQNHSRDHIAIAPEMISPGVAVGMFVGGFTLLFSIYARPWKAPDASSPCFIGIGAFNMVTAAAYRAIGGHSRIAMRPDDDIKLGKIIKDAGYSQEMLFGRGSVAVEWYASLGEVIRGLEKNSLAGVEYSVVAIVSAALSQLLLLVWPFIALLFTSGWTLMLYAVTCALLVAAYASQTKQVGVPRWYAIGAPFSAALFAWIVLRATWITLRNDGISWRGTHYPLAALKANKV